MRLGGPTCGQQVAPNCVGIESKAKSADQHDPGRVT